MSKDLALFDFDGTITNRDSFIDFIKFYHGSRAFYKGFIRLMPTLLLYKLKLIPNWQAKERVLTYFFKDEPVQKFQRKCDHYAIHHIPAMVRPKALEKLKVHISKGDEVYVVSASAENWLAAWCRNFNIHLIATQLEIKEGRVTGKIKGQNCYGPEKVKRIQAKIMLNNYQQIHCYGDSSGDREMLALAHFPNYRVF